MGYEAMREQILARQKELGIVPADTELPPINPIGTPETRTGPDGKPFPALDYTRPWDSLSADEQRLFAGWPRSTPASSPTPTHQIGRLLDYLEETGQRENTMVIVVSDNGASGEGGPNGSVNENKFFNGIPDDLEENLPCSTSSAARRPTTTTPTAGRWRSTRRSRCGSATSSTAARPTRASSRGRPASRRTGEIRDQYHHAIDLVPTVLDCLGVEPPETIDGHVQSPIDGVSMRYSFDAAAAAQRARRRSSTRCSARGRSGTTAGRPSPPTRRISGWGNFGKDTWELYHADVDRSELHDLAAEEPERLQELIGLWFAEAGANGAFPLDDRSALEIILTPRPQLTRRATATSTTPARADVPESQAANIRNRSYTIGALVDIPGAGRAGRAVRPRRRFGGHALYVKDNRLHYVYNFVGSVEQKIVATEDLPTGEDLILSAAFEKDGEDPPGVGRRHALALPRRREGRRGPHQDPARQVLARRRGAVRRTRQRRARSPTTTPASAPWAFTGGTIHRVAVDVSGEPYVDLEREAAAMLAAGVRPEATSPTLPIEPTMSWWCRARTNFRLRNCDPRSVCRMQPATVAAAGDGVV